MLFAAAWAVEAASRFEAGRNRTDTAWIVPLVASFTVLVLLVAAQAMARSRAGLGLTIVALFGALALALTDRRNTGSVSPARLLFGATSLAVIFAVQYALYRILQRFEVDPLEDARIVIARNTFSAAKAYMPVGSGMGTFVTAYAPFEKPTDAMIDTYANRAHNDVLEMLLEAGGVGLFLMCGFMVWLMIASAKVWRRNAPGTDIDRALARAAAVVIVLLIVHSLFDYPLRTGAMMAIFAFSCALMVEPGKEAEGPAEGVKTYSKPWPAAPPVDARYGVGPPTFETPAQAQPRSAERWGEDTSWPQEWLDPDKPRPATRAPNGPRPTTKPDRD
jgi:O-antigen ligase